MVNAEDKESRLASLIKTNKKIQFFQKLVNLTVKFLKGG